MTLDPLRVRNIRSVPSVHGRAVFARIAESLIDSWRPDAIAVEIPWVAHQEFVSALRELPRIQAVCMEPRGRRPRRPLSILVLDPADSIVAAARRGLERGLPVHCIDLHLGGVDRQSPATIPDERLLDHAGLSDYYAWWVESPRARIPPDRPTLRRECFMSSRLARLAREHERVLVVLGMAHWERVRRLTERFLESGGTPVPRRPRRPELAVTRADVAPEALPSLLRQLPFYSGRYERARPHVSRYTSAGALALLLARAHARLDVHHTLPVGGARRLASMIRRVARHRRRLSPALSDILGVAKAMVGRRYARQVFELAGEYPQPRPSGRLPVVVTSPELRDGPWRRGRVIVFPRNPETTEEGERLRELIRELYEDGPPARCGSYRTSLFVTDPVENRKEDRIAERIAARLLTPSSPGSTVTEFRSGLHAGLDVRKTLADSMGRGRIFVRRALSRAAQSVDRVGALVLEFRHRDPERGPDPAFWKDCEHAGPKYWKVGYYASERQCSPDGQMFAEYALLTIIFDKTLPTRSVRRIWSQEIGPLQRCRAGCIHVALRYAPPRRPVVGYVAPQPPAEDVYEEAARSGRTLVYRSYDSMADLLRQIAGFHMRWSDDPSEAE